MRPLEGIDWTGRGYGTRLAGSVDRVSGGHVSETLGDVALDKVLLSGTARWWSSSTWDLAWYAIYQGHHASQSRAHDLWTRHIFRQIFLLVSDKI